MIRQGKHMLKLVLLSGMLVAGGAVQQAAAQDSDPVNTRMYYNSQFSNGTYNNPQNDNSFISYSDFYNYLAPYGQWIEDPRYGYVWSPNVDESFRPSYTNGYWAMTDYGNTWISEYQWGWACFHYGRWTFDAYYGWLWVPGTNWGPAWVSWRYGNGCYGWAPLAPGYEFTPNPIEDYACPRDWWVFIPYRYLYTGNYYNYYYGSQGNGTIYKGTVVMDNTYTANNITYVAGPRVKDIEKVTNQPVQVYRINNSGSPRGASVHNGIVKMFRPAEVKPLPLTGERITPPNVVAAPRAITAKPNAVNSTGGGTPAFRRDVPAPAIPVVVRQAVPRGTTTPKPAGPADNYPYQSDLHAHQDGQARPGTGHVAQKPGALPEQRPQDAEPVEIKQTRTPPLPTPAQHADPIPAAPRQPKPEPKPVPTQHPDPVEPTKK